MIVASFCFDYATVERYDNGRIVAHYWDNRTVNITTDEFNRLMKSVEQA